ncbi:hypothetical protein VOLCADRAFT_92698 [Volvox carteri f. nagariensis]|uniref:Bifunctional inhibitor/plant lipid transfer protein/seed storage helical domain-containing protein n=1 Tax=Volvox carteri f. nagariensis TaxID=3068 RepID=D8U0A5_VOLCA|nr:uncharacterized protein VOLCADRAFT_92698 [Volvox carteri f. nagariensis]EFJ46827.1 hypothetical protein VOLCADRAFT_92698 [Volvox carteri f. nagariensis]|eukprot:XP_002952036.1 hypothetical protein VOLCADRAFT_92698 [Volvox carteri f. nagariensis]
MAALHARTLAVAAAAVLVVFLSAAPSLAQLPDKNQCISTASAQSGNVNVLAPCVGGPSSSCCSTVKGFAGPGAPLGYCLCYPDLEEQLLSTVENDATARRFGVTRSAVVNVLQSCSVPFASGTGGAACPSGAAVAVSAPTTKVGVAPSGATTVSEDVCVAVQGTIMSCTHRHACTRACNIKHLASCPAS